MGPEPGSWCHVVDGTANTPTAVSPGLWGKHRGGGPGSLGAGNRARSGGCGGTGLLGVTPEFRGEREAGLMKGRWGREREERGSGQAKPKSKGQREGHQNTATSGAFPTSSAPALLQDNSI